MTQARPTLSARMSGQELLRWYWLRDELAGFARTLGVSASGSKQALTARLVAHLDGRPLPPPPPARPPAPPALREPLTASTVIPHGQRCTQQLRRYFDDAVGGAFVFDAPMREFIGDGAGLTLGAAVARWHATRSRPAPEIGSQFELNTFLRGWHLRHPGEPRARALDAWRAHRQLPAEARHPGSASDDPSSRGARGPGRRPG